MYNLGFDSALISTLVIIMKPVICTVCGKAPKSSQDGDWLAFADFKASEVSDLSHPGGLEYFCGEHLDAARRLQGMIAIEAIGELQRQFDSVSQTNAAQNTPKPVWKRWLGL
ncbi:hypothetical protein [Oceanobacter mangrovi]|uniref:hypothetical protein n=1 Tax=Oceanobacter mangrovi TaxID=2862510 RepID=UPI001C8D1E9B|nr:hypothetical protein [Oceanobacter mangrovi]